MKGNLIGIGILLLMAGCMAQTLITTMPTIPAGCTFAQNFPMEDAVYTGCLARPAMGPIPFKPSYTPDDYQYYVNKFRTNRAELNDFLEWYAIAEYWRRRGDPANAPNVQSDNYSITFLNWLLPNKYNIPVNPDATTVTRTTPTGVVPALDLNPIDCCAAYLHSQYIKTGPYDNGVPRLRGHNGPLIPNPNPTPVPGSADMVYIPLAYDLTNTNDPVSGKDSIINPWAAATPTKPLVTKSSCTTTYNKNTAEPGWSFSDRLKYLGTQVGGSYSASENAAYLRAPHVSYHPLLVTAAFALDVGNPTCGHLNNLLRATVTKQCYVGNGPIVVGLNSVDMVWRGGSEFTMLTTLKNQCSAFYTSIGWTAPF